MIGKDDNGDDDDGDEKLRGNVFHVAHWATKGWHREPDCNQFHILFIIIGRAIAVAEDAPGIASKTIAGLVRQRCQGQSTHGRS